jgi:hypothetical protein
LSISALLTISAPNQRKQNQTGTLKARTVLKYFKPNIPNTEY